MDLYELMEKRKSIRNYSSKEVEDDKLKRILEAGRLAPSGKNAQAWRFIVTRDEDLKEELMDACRGQKAIKEADCVITVCVNEQEVFQSHGNYMTCAPIDGTIAMDHMILAATKEGLGTCWIGAFTEEAVKEALEIPDPFRVIALTPLGYPAFDGREKTRKPLDEIVIWEKWE